MHKLGRKSSACPVACFAVFVLWTHHFGGAASTTNSSNSSAGLSVSPVLENYGSFQRHCKSQPQCPWIRLANPDADCCPQEPGEECYPAEHLVCNTELGYRCVDNASLTTELLGVCQGPFNVTSPSVGETRVTLEWTPFALPDYSFEYVVLVRKDSHHWDTSHWELRDCGVEPRCVLSRLTPLTTYLFKIATWKDVRAGTFDTTTETVIVRTEAVEHCDDMGRHIEVGQVFIQDEEQKCACLASGEFDCSPLCPNGIPEMENGCHVVLGENCQYNITCEVEEFQENEDENDICMRYPNEAELRIDCKVCHCVDERLVCSYSEICNIQSPKPPCKKVREIKIPGFCCPEWDCEDVCEYDNNTYSGGEMFTSQYCDLCQCQQNGDVECISNCPPVEMVPPSAECPMPHIKRSGCCDTLHCFLGNRGSFSYVNNLVALYTTAVTLTLSFEVEPECEINGFPSYCYYRIQYSNTSYYEETHKWKNRLVHPVDIINDSVPTYLHPIDVVTKDTAIVIDGRAVITLSGMHPHTEFYVVVSREEEDREDMANIEDSILTVRDMSLAAVVVVKTRPLENETSCFYGGREVLHGETVSRQCNQACMCLLGEIQCHSTCADETLVIAASLSCPQPQLEKQEGECCPKWQCHPAVLDCKYNTAFLRHGQVISDGCQECVCKNSTVKCVSLCPPSGPSPRPGCVLTNHTGHCCSQWSCPLETSLPLAVESSIILKFLGSCKAPVDNFKKSFEKKVLEHIAHVTNCSNPDKAGRNLCNKFRANVKCNVNHSHHESYVKRSVDTNYGGQVILVYVTVWRNFSSERDSEIVVRSSFNLQKLLNMTFTVELPSGPTLKSLATTNLRKPVYLCLHGFTYKNGKCVLSRIDITGTKWTQVVLSPVDILSNSVTFQWPPLQENLQDHIKSLHIIYRLKGTLSWTSTKVLEPWRTSITVMNLQPATMYMASLVALAFENNDHKWILGDVSFTTQESAAQASLSITLKEVSALANSIVLYWGNLSDLWSTIESANILYWISNSDQTHLVKIENREFPFTTIEGLAPSTEYNTQMVVHLSNGKTIRSPELRITTIPTEICYKSLLLPVFIACFGAAAIVVILLLLGLLWRRSHKKNSSTNFENKTFGISLESNAGSGNNTAPLPPS